MILKLWLNAFIPGLVPGYTHLLRAGRHAGKSAVPLPNVARLNPLNTLKNLDAGYLTDQRDFSEDPGASVRMQSLAAINLASAPQAIAFHHGSSGTTEVDMDSGEQLGFAIADTDNCKFRPGNAQTAAAWEGLHRRACDPTKSSKNAYLLELCAAASDPLVSGAADIDYQGIFRIEVLSRAPYDVRVDFGGEVDAFPAFECYASLGGRTKALFRLPPPAGNTVVDLLGGPSRAVFAGVRFP